MEELKEVRNIEKAINQASASIWLDNLPLSVEYVQEYKNKRLKNVKNTKSLVLRRGNINGKKGK